MLITKTRKWGNSMGVVIPKEIVEEMKLTENQDVEIELKLKENPLRKLFGAAKGKVTKSTDDILKESRKNTSKYF